MNGETLGLMTIRAILLGQIAAALKELRRDHRSSSITDMNCGKVVGLIQAAGLLAAISFAESLRLKKLAINASEHNNLLLWEAE